MIVGAPHTSGWDFVVGMVVIWALGLNMSWMAKDSLFGWPHGIFMRWLGGVPVRVHEQVVRQLTVNCANGQKDKRLWL